MRWRFGLVVMLLGMLGVRIAGAQLVQPAAVRDLAAQQAVWPLHSELRPARLIIERHRHPVAGAVVGAGVGVLIALVHASNDANKCQNDRCQVGAIEPVITIPLFGVAGAVVGGFIGWMIRTE